MKKLLFLIVLIPFFSCDSEKLDQTKAVNTVEALIQNLNEQEYDKTSDFYTDSFNSGEPLEVRTEKFKALRNAMGAIQSKELVETEHESNFAEQAKLNLTYKIKYARVTAIEKFTIVKEANAYKIARHDIRTDNI